MGNATAALGSRIAEGDVMKVLIEAGETLYAGTMVCADADGYAINAADTANFKFLGVVKETVTNSGADGAEEAEVYTEGVFKFTSSGLTQADHGKFVYATDNQTVSLTAATNVGAVGWIWEVLSATSCLVKLCKLPVDAIA